MGKINPLGWIGSTDNQNSLQRDVAENTWLESLIIGGLVGLATYVATDSPAAAFGVGGGTTVGTQCVFSGAAKSTAISVDRANDHAIDTVLGVADRAMGILVPQLTQAAQAIQAPAPVVQAPAPDQSAILEAIARLGSLVSGIDRAVGALQANQGSMAAKLSKLQQREQPAQQQQAAKAPVAETPKQEEKPSGFVVC
jgi:hypothetical protein